ncbi:hypothetical protein [Aromatoleum anaerobium]|uniref:hypothetical protein n=1 Tax=Aromatoleum anaerobium TaxID=182180 RepID=UPI001FF32283|nr:hypothetical protein [Aromatoleum anaerobium]MCK0509352.1 hypothetical protein [Aromatoleum anaerobium]
MCVRLRVGCYNRAACEILAADEATLLDYQDLGVLLMLRHAGLEIAEVPVAMYPRATGPSRIFASRSFAAPRPAIPDRPESPHR